MKKIVFTLLLFSSLSTFALLPPEMHMADPSCPKDAPFRRAEWNSKTYRNDIPYGQCISCNDPRGLMMDEADCAKCPNRTSVGFNDIISRTHCRLKKCPPDKPAYAGAWNWEGCKTCDDADTLYTNKEDCAKCPNRRWVDVADVCAPRGDKDIYFKETCTYEPETIIEGRKRDPKIDCSQLSSTQGVITSAEECARCSNTRIENGCCVLNGANTAQISEQSPAKMPENLPKLKNANYLDDLQIFKDTDGIVKKIKSPDEYPAAQKEKEKIVAYHTITQPYQACLKLGFPEVTDQKQLSEQLKKCRGKMESMCDKILDDCREKSRQGINTDKCEKNYKQCRDDYFNNLNDSIKNLVLHLSEWTINFFKLNRKLATPFSGDLWVKNDEGKEELYLYQDGIQKEKYDFSIQDIEDEHLSFYQKLDTNGKKRLYLLTSNDLYSGIILKEKLPKKEFCILHYLAQDYKDGLPINEPYELTVAFCNQPNLRSKVSMTIGELFNKKHQSRESKKD